MSVKSYGGIEFPSWFDIDSFNPTFLEMYNFLNVSSLPSLEALKELSIESMPAVKEGGVESYGIVSSSTCSNAFRYLEILIFQNVENWQICPFFNNVEYEGHVFPGLRKLEFRSCPKLVGDFPKCFHSIEKLVIDKCDDMQHLWRSKTEVERLGCLKDLKISNCSKLVSLVEGQEGVLPPNLQLLNIYKCDNLERLPNLTSLTTLRIDRCPRLTTIGDLPDNLKEVKITGCGSLERLPEEIAESETFIDDLAEMNLLGVGPSFREQHGGRRRPVSEECVSHLLLGKAPSFQLTHFTGTETALELTSNRFRSNDDLLGRSPSIDEVRDDLVRSYPILGLLLGRDPSMDSVRGDLFRLSPEYSLEPTAASSSFRSYDDLVGCCPSMDHVPDDLVTCSPSLGLQGGLDQSVNHERDDLSRHSPENGSRYDNFSHHGPTGSYHSTTSDEDEASTSLR